MRPTCSKAVIITFLILLFSFNAQAKSDRENTIVVSNSLSSASVRSFVEDHMGRMWIGTARGLNRYDIHTYYNYFKSDEEGSIPDNEIYTMYCDSRDRLWISTPAGIAYRTEEDRFKTVLKKDNANICLSMTETNEGKMVLSLTYGLWIYNPSNDTVEEIRSWTTSTNYKVYTDNKGYVWLLEEDQLVCFDSKSFSAIDSVDVGYVPTASALMRNGDIWLASTGARGVSKFSTSKRTIDHNYIQSQMSRLVGSDNILRIQEYSSGDILFLDNESRMYFLASDSENLYAQTDAEFPFSVSGQEINNVYIDSRQNVWIGYMYSGYEVKYNFGSQFNRNQFLVSFFKDKPVVAVASDEEDNLYCLAVNDALYKYSSKDRTIKRMKITGRSEYPDLLSNALSLFVDKDNDLWVGGTGEYPLLCFSVSGETLRHKGTIPISIALDYAYDASGNLWASGICPFIVRISKEDMSYDKIYVSKESIRTIASSLDFKDGKIVCGIYPHGIKTIDPVTLEVKDLISREAFSSAIKNGTYIPTSFYLDANEDLWISTNSNGLFRYHSGKDQLERIEGVPCSDVASIIEDESGSIWIGTADGLSRYNLKTGSIMSYFKEDGIGGNQFYDRSVVRLSDGSLVLGGTHGLTLVDPSMPFRYREVPLVFEDLKVSNLLISPGEDQPIDKHLSLLPNVRLRHDQNNFSISFSFLDYSEDLSMNYSYKLEGYDKDWTDLGTINVATYTNVGPGKYKFVVRAVGKNGALETESSLNVCVIPAFWETWWMKVVYIFVILSVVLIFFETRKRMMVERESLQKAEMEKEQEKKMNKMNMSFFANVAHEFRTPLTMIAGPVGVLSSNTRIVGRDRELLEVVKKSVNRMLQLVNQFMDFNKLENDTLRLSVSRGDIVKDIKSCMEVFSVSAEQKSISVGVHCLEEHFEMWYDSDKLMKVISNLMSNALKFTPSGGSVSLSFDIVSGSDVDSLVKRNGSSAYQRYAKISVTDTGLGVPEDKYDAIFQRYIQLDNQSNATRNIGTGIGLYYAKALVELHHGMIKVGARSAGSGAVFTFVIPVDDSAYSEAERTEDRTDQTRLYPVSDRIVLAHEESELGEDAQTILVVDDDIDVANYLEILLSNKYRVLKSYNGENALALVKDSAPDIVISDVVMPGMTGYQLCETIKSDIQLSHIPVILVTAKVTVESQVEGLGKGADAYVTKPFDPAYLSALIESVLKNREMMRKQISSSTEADDNISSSLSSQDSRLLKDLYSIMEAELVNPELDVEQMSHRLKISRTKLYYKIKGLTGVSPGEFFRQYKLNRAAQLLKEGIHNVSEVADMTGFSNQSYFSTAFKKQFGVSPSEYK